MTDADLTPRRVLMDDDWPNWARWTPACAAREHDGPHDLTRYGWPVLICGTCPRPWA